MKILSNFKRKQVRNLAYCRYLNRGCIHGKDQEDWYVCTKWWPWNWLWNKTPKKILLFLIMVILIGQIFYDMSVTRILDYALPAQIKEPLSQNRTMFANYNIRPEFYDKNLAPIIKEFRYPLVNDFKDRVIARFKCFRKSRPFIVVHQSAYSHIYFVNGSINYSLVPFMTLKNIGNSTAIITCVNIKAINELAKGLSYPNFIPFLPIELFPNEELILFYGQEMPPAKFVSDIEVGHKDLKGDKYQITNKKEFLNIFNRKILN